MDEVLTQEQLMDAILSSPQMDAVHIVTNEELSDEKMSSQPPKWQLLHSNQKAAFLLGTTLEASEHKKGLALFKKRICGS